MSDPLQTLIRRAEQWLAASGARACLRTQRNEKDTDVHVELVPVNQDSAAVALALADESDELNICVGAFAYWNGIPDAPRTLEQVCTAVAGGAFTEETCHVRGIPVARRARLVISASEIWRWGELNPFAVMPFLRWQRREYAPW